MNRIVVLPGDGIGPEVTAQARRVLESVCASQGIALELVEELIGGASIDAHGTPLREEVVELCRGSRAVLLGAVGGPSWDAMAVDVRPERGLLAIRKALGLFATPRTAKRQCGRNQRVIRVPDTSVFTQTTSYLLARGITRLVLEGTLISLDA